MKIILLYTLLLFSVTLSAQWRLVYENDTEGKAIRGSKDQLVAAVSNGAEVRVGWVETYGRANSRHFEHYATANSVVIYATGELLVELPSLADYDIGRRDRVLIWDDGRRIPIVSTAGKVEFKRYGESPMVRRSSVVTAVKWFVKE